MEDALQKEVEALAQSAITHAQQQFNVRLDFSPRSVEHVEEILGKLHALIPQSRLSRIFNPRPDFHDVARIANSYGAYVGEIIRRECGGQWETTEVCGCENILVLRIRSDFTLMPTTKTWNRLTMGPSESVLNYYNRSLQRSAELRKATPVAQ